mgnify:CR=1 FL=1
MPLSERTERFLAELVATYGPDYHNATLSKGRFPGNPAAAWVAMLHEAYARGRMDEREGWPEPTLPDLREPAETT